MICAKKIPGRIVEKMLVYELDNSGPCAELPLQLL